MDNQVLCFSDFLNEELNFTKYDTGVCRLEDRWFFYNPEDDIIYGSNEKPVGDNVLFAFNPTACIILLGGEEKQYDINNPVCLIAYDLEKEEVGVYTDKALEYLQRLGWKGDNLDFQSQQCRSSLMDLFDDNEDFRLILLYGDQMVASSFDVIEEN